MAHITRFAISGLAGKQSDHSQALNRDTNIFYGPNGSGKTTLLKILHSAMSGNTGILENLPFKSASVSIYSDDYKREYHLQIAQTPHQASLLQPEDDITSYQTVGEALRHSISRQRIKKSHWETKPRPPKVQTGWTWAHRYLPISRLYASSMPYGRYEQNEDVEEVFNQLFAKSVSNLWRIYTSKLLVAVKKAQEDGLTKILRDTLATSPQKSGGGSLDTQAAYSRVRRFLQRQGAEEVLTRVDLFESRYSSDPMLRRIVSDINDIEERIEQVMMSREELRTIITSMFAGDKRVTFLDNDIEVRISTDESPISLAALSSGEKQMLRLFIEGLLAEGNTIIIDEPELSMHVDWQRTFLTSMQRLNSRAQIIVATHSPEIMADFPDEKIFRL